MLNVSFRVFRFFLAMCCFVLVVSCSYRFPLSGTLNVSGTASLAPVQNAVVDVYTLNSDGSRGALVASSTTGSGGSYSVMLPSSGTPLLVLITGGTYTEEAGGTVSVGSNTISAVVPASTGGSQTVSVTPLTHMATSRALALVAAGYSVNDAVTAANLQTANAAGLSSILTAPADPTQTVSDPSSQAAKYALILAAISELAVTNGVTSVDMANSFANDFYDGVLDGTKSGSQVTVGTNLTLPSNAWATGLAAARSTYLSSGQNKAGFTSSSTTSLLNAPPLIMPTPTPTPSPTPYLSIGNSGSLNLSTPTPTPTPRLSLGGTGTTSATPTPTPRTSPTPTLSIGSTGTYTATPTPTPHLSIGSTGTLSVGSTGTYSATPTPTPSLSIGSTGTLSIGSSTTYIAPTPTPTPSLSIGNSGTLSLGSTGTYSATPTPTPVLSVGSSGTLSLGSTTTYSATPTPTPVLSYGNSGTLSLGSSGTTISPSPTP